MGLMWKCQWSKRCDTHGCVWGSESLLHEVPTLALWLWSKWLFWSQHLPVIAAYMQPPSEGPLRRIFIWQGTLGNAHKFQDSQAASFTILMCRADFYACLSPLSRRWKRHNHKTVFQMTSSEAISKQLSAGWSQVYDKLNISLDLLWRFYSLANTWEPKG